MILASLLFLSGLAFSGCISNGRLFLFSFLSCLGLWSTLLLAVRSLHPVLTFPTLVCILRYNII